LKIEGPIDLGAEGVAGRGGAGETFVGAEEGKDGSCSVGVSPAVGMGSGAMAFAAAGIGSGFVVSTVVGCNEDFSFATGASCDGFISCPSVFVAAFCCCTGSRHMSRALSTQPLIPLPSTLIWA